MEIQGDGFRLRGWRRDDVVSIQRHADNPNIYNYLLDRFPHPYTMEAAENWVSMMLSMKPNYNLVIEVQGEAAGVIGLEMRDDVYRKSPLLGYWIGEAYWGRGIAPKAIALITDFAFRHLDMMRVQAGVLSNNPRSMRALEKAGFRQEGILRNNIIKHGQLLDEHIFGLLRPL